METAILLSMRSDMEGVKILRDAAQTYKVDVDAISAKAKDEFAAKEKSNRVTQKQSTKQPPKSGNRRSAA